jgi:hypothetical protein
MPSPKSEGEFTFTIGDGFPADDEVARFLVVLAMMSNDLLRLVDSMLHADDQDVGARLFSFRVQTALFYEASSFVRLTPTRWPAVKSFLDGLSADMRDDFQRVAGATDPSSDMFLGPWIKDNRNRVFHYPRMLPDRPAAEAPLVSALERCADVEGQISVGTGQEIRSVRFGFADTITVQWLPDADEPGAVIEALRERVVALVGLAHQAIASYIAGRHASS